VENDKDQGNVGQINWMTLSEGARKVSAWKTSMTGILRYSKINQTSQRLKLSLVETITLSQLPLEKMTLKARKAAIIPMPVQLRSSQV
jgi:hypothetical protein